MALRDDPAAWILLMFHKEECEGRGQHCQTFPNGTRMDFLPIESDELVYGIYKHKYFFTPTSVFVVGDSGTNQIPWKSVVTCSTKHGDGKRNSTLTLVDGRTVNFKISDLVTGSSGRISQLYHQMIESFGGVSAISTSTIDDFVSQATSNLSLFPNLHPHPGNTALVESINGLLSVDQITDIRIHMADDDSESGIGLIVRTTLSSDKIDELTSALGSDGAVDETAKLDGVFENLNNDERVVRVIWD
ncbi:hypothetical protein C2E31_20895 [Rhodopirellula baltica]|nr:hypothetical protein C2E31_20895 [Rhodopirellula baltica]